METDHLLSVPDVATMWGVKKSSVYQAVKSGKLPAVTVLGRFAIKKLDAEAYHPRQYRERPGSKGKGGRPKAEKNDTETSA